MANEITKTNNNAVVQNKISFTDFMTSNAITQKVNEIIGNPKDGARFITNIVAVVNANPALRECSNQSMLSCALVAHSLNLSLSPALGQAWVVPYNNKTTGIKEAQFQLSYKSYIQLAIRSGYYKKINVLAIKEGELIKYDPLNEEIEVKLIEDEVEREKAPIMGFYAMYEYVNGFKKCIYWSNEKMLAFADKYSQAFSRKIMEDILNGKIPEKDMWKYSSPWYSRYEEMGNKSLIKQLLSKYGILSIEMQDALEKDQSVINEDGTPKYVDNNNDDYIIAEENNVVEEKEIQTKSLSDVE